MNKKPIQIPGSKGHLTLGNTYKHRYVAVECPECGNNKAYIDKWHTRLHMTCMKRDCRQDWYLNRWEDTPTGRRDTYLDYVSEEGNLIEDKMRELQGSRSIPLKKAE